MVWGPCGREACLVCEHGSDPVSKCKQRNIVYKTSCKECKAKGLEINYYGESARTSYERGKEHMKDYLDQSEESHMMKHHVTEHPEIQEPVDFSMKVIKAHRTPFTRQIHEAVLIQMNEKNGILNSKSEFNRCQLPRLSIMMGVKEVLENKEKEMTEEEEEDCMKKEKRKNEKDDLFNEVDKRDGMCPPPAKRKKIWSKNLPKKRRRKKNETNGSEAGGVTDNHVSDYPKQKKKRMNENVPEGWKDDNASCDINFKNEAKHIKASNKISPIIQYYNNLDETIKKKKIQNIHAKEQFSEISSVYQGGEIVKISPAKPTEQLGGEKTDYENKAKTKPSKYTSTPTPSPHQTNKRIRKKKLNDLQPPKWRYSKLSEFFKSKQAPEIESEILPL